MISSLTSNLLKSPLTGGDVRLVDNFDVSDIVRLYKQQENLDVSPFFSYGEKVDLFECNDTGYRFYYPFDIAGDEKFYQDLQKANALKGLEYDRDWADDHKFAFTEIADNAKVLEIGCNTGKFLKRLLPKTKKLTGLDFNDVAIFAANAKGLNVINESAEIHAEKHTEEYDVVCAFQVLEHITSAGSLLEAATKLLRKDGKLILSVPNNDPFFQRFNRYEVLNLPPHHVGLWNLKAFRNLENYFDLKLVNHHFSGFSPMIVDAYLRAKMMAGVKTLPHRHSIKEKIKIYANAPLAVVKSAFDYAQKRRSYVHLTVVFTKRNKLYGS
jgi:2-polyprenyl-3-methyl-5-hydroxy-6-metoxy-1,4-benzoquinol methylase